MDPTGFWMRLPDDVVREVFPWEEFALARTLVDTGVPDGEPKTTCSPGCASGARAERRSPWRPMPQYLSQDWLDAGRGAGGRPARAARRDGADPVAS